MKKGWRKPEPEYPPSTHRGETYLSIPDEQYASLMEMATEIGFIHAGKPSVKHLLDTISQIDVDSVYNLIEDEGMLPERSYYPIQ
jgi:hypothetical protein